MNANLFHQFEFVSRIEVKPPGPDRETWRTTVDFVRKGSEKPVTICFESSGRYLDIWDLLMGFDSVELIDRTDDGLEFGQFQLCVVADDGRSYSNVDRWEIIDPLPPT